MNLTDEERERLIDLFAQLELGDLSPAMKRYLWSLRKDLINSRSAEQIAKMEREKGLSAA